MADDLGFAGHDALSYEDDIPYEAQLPNSLGEVDASSLKKRIGNRIYLLEDSMSKKRKKTDAEDNAEEYEAEDKEGNADPHYRPNALLLQGPPITQLPTARIFAYATHFDAHPIGLEWLDDKTCVLIFANRKKALQAWNSLRRPSQPDNHKSSTGMEVEDTDETFCSAHPLPLALYPIELRVSAVLGIKEYDALKQGIRIRWARFTDVKARGARNRSEFYKRHGETAGKEGLLGFSNSGRGDEHRNKRRRQDDDEERRRQLDAELDNFLVENEGSSDHMKSRRGNDNEGREEDWSQSHEEKRRMLDSELDSFLSNGNDQLLDPTESGTTENTHSDSTLPKHTKRLSPSVRGRRISALPRRGHDTNTEGRWLHNVEMTSSRRRDDYDKDDFGMRAWSRERTRRSKPRKTQEELDRELDQMWQSTE